MVATLNPYVASANSATYIPDRLIGGDKKLVTRNAIIAQGQGVLYRGSVMGRSTATASTGAAKAGGNTGNGTIGAVAGGNTPLPGVYTLTMLTPTTFSVYAPDGTQRPNGVVGQPYENTNIGFVITAGGTAFVAGDGFTITTTAPSGEYLLSISTATDGSQNPIGILVDAVDTTATFVLSSIYVEGEFNANSLVFGAGLTAAGVMDALAIRGVHIKFPVSGAPIQY